MVEIEIPRENANDDDVVITHIFVEQYQKVDVGDVLFEFETSKAAVEVSASETGIVSLNLSVGQTVKVGTTVVIIDNEKRTFDDIVYDKIPRSTKDDKYSEQAIELINEHNLDLANFDEFEFVTTQDVKQFIQENSTENSVDLEIYFSTGEIALYGAGLQCQVVLDLIATENLDIKVAVIIDSKPKMSNLDGIPILSKDYIPKLIERGLEKIHICIGDGKTKRSVASELIVQGLDIVNIVASTAVVSETSNLGVGVFLGSNSYVGRGVSIGDLCQINHFTSIAHHCCIGSGTFIADGCRIGGTVTIGDDVQLGIGVNINRDIEIARDVSVPSGITVIKNIIQGEKVKTRKQIAS